MLEREYSVLGCRISAGWGASGVAYNVFIHLQQNFIVLLQIKNL